MVDIDSIMSEMDFDNFEFFDCTEDEFNRLLNVDEELDPLDSLNENAKKADYLCGNCNEGFNTIMDYIKHLQTHDEDLLYSCHLCDYGKIKTLSTMKSHLISYHNISKSLLVSSKKSKKVECVEEESKVRKTGSPSSWCEICSEVFDNKELLNQHLESHPSIYTCDICGEELKLAIDFIMHCQQHSKHKLYECILCTHTNNSISRMKSHLQARHQQFKKYTCQICNQKFSVLTHFVEHENFHKKVKPFQCQICSKTFMYSRYLNSHIKLEHVNGNFKCQYCQEQFESKSDCNRHLKRHRRKKFQCERCGKILSGLDKLKNHFRIHTGEKPYNCNYCEKAFTTTTRLKEHENIHKGIKPYKCNYCEKFFTQPTPLTNHIRSLHTLERPFICVACDKTFVSKSFLNYHRKKCNGKEM